MTIMQNILGDIEKLELREIFDSLAGEDICDVMPSVAIKMAFGGKPFWSCPIKDIRPMYIADIHRGEFIHSPSSMSMITYDCSGMLSVADVADYVPESAMPEMWAVIGEFIKTCGASARICLFDIGSEDIFVRYGACADSTLKWQVLIKSVGRVISYDAGGADVLTAITHLDESTVRMKPLEVWALWVLCNGSNKGALMSLEVFDKIVDTWGSERLGAGAWRRSYRALQKCIGMPSDDIAMQFAVPEWICGWGLWPVGVGAPVAAAANNA
jgi:hypothetical protein